jgi:hypothetical protein
MMIFSFPMMNVVMIVVVARIVVGRLVEPLRGVGTGSLTESYLGGAEAFWGHSRSF